MRAGWPFGREHWAAADPTAPIGEHSDQRECGVGEGLGGVFPKHILGVGEVQMEEIAEHAGISRALLYRYFPTKRDLFAAIYRQAADRLLAQTELDPAVPVVDQISTGLDAHIDYFIANRNTVLAANRTLAGDPVIQAVITGELAILRQRLVDASGLTDHKRGLVSAALTSWLVFVRVLCVEWLANQSFSRTELRQMCLGALLGALGTVTDLAQPPAG